jgi:hypothetical protein
VSRPPHPEPPLVSNPINLIPAMLTDNCTYKLYVSKSRNKKSGYKELKKYRKTVSMNDFGLVDYHRYLPDDIFYIWNSFCRVLILRGLRGKLTRVYNGKEETVHKFE